LVRDLVAGSGAAAVFVNYTPLPEARYPTAINQAYAATKWITEHGQEINVDGKRLAVVGNSVGGNMAAVASLMAKDRGTPDINYQVLLWPVTDANFENASYDEFAEGHFLTRNMMKWFWDNYTPDPKQRQGVYASPLQATPNGSGTCRPPSSRRRKWTCCAMKARPTDASWMPPAWMSPWSVTTA
jgi:acetyl esterase/lipase